MTGVFQLIGSTFTTFIGYVGDVADAIVNNELLVFTCIGVPLVGLGVGLFNRLTRFKA